MILNLTSEQSRELWKLCCEAEDAAQALEKAMANKELYDTEYENAVINAEKHKKRVDQFLEIL